MMLAALNIGLWAFFGLGVLIELVSLYLSVRRVLGHSGPSPVLGAPLAIYLIRIGTIWPTTATRFGAMVAVAVLAHGLMGFGIPALVRRLAGRPRNLGR
jgi:hypothetical protein